MRGKVRVDISSNYPNQHPLTLTLSPKGRGNLHRSNSETLPIKPVHAHSPITGALAARARKGPPDLEMG